METRRWAVVGIVILAVALMIPKLVWASLSAEDGSYGKVYLLMYESPQKMRDILQKSLPPYEGRKIEINEKTGSLSINDLPENHERIKMLLKEHDKPPKQIQIEALLIKASDAVLKELGIYTTLKKTPNREKMLATCTERKDIELFSYPTINVVDGVMGSCNLTQPVQYMQKLPDGNFMLITHEEPVGTIFEITATINNEKYIDAEVNFQVIKLVKRLPIEGIYLDIGHPIYDKVSFKNKVRLKNGKVMRLGGGKYEVTKTTPLRTTHSTMITLIAATIITEKNISPHQPPKKKYTIREIKHE